MPKYIQNKKRQHGFGMIELMVGIVVGLISVLAIMKTTTIFQSQRSSTVSGASAQEVGMTSIMMLERGVQGAGYGLEANLTKWCDMGVPALIQNGATDGLLITRNEDMTGAASAKLDVDLAQGQALIYMLRDPELGFQINNQVVIVDWTDQNNVLCSKPLKINNVGSKQHTAGETPSYPYTLSAAPVVKISGSWVGHAFPKDKSSVFSLGTGLVQQRYCLNGSNLLLESAVGLSTSLFAQTCGATVAGKTQTQVASNVVDLQLQYGISDVNGKVITEWVEATGAWAESSVNMNQDLIKRIRAVRMTVVAVNAKKTSQNISEPCTAQSNADGPCAWEDSDLSDKDNPPLIKLQGRVADWQRYRYSIYRATVPVRNMLGS